MTKFSNHFDLIYGHHRYNFLFQDDYISKYCKSYVRDGNILERSPLIAFIGRHFNIYWEYRDGVLDSASPVESCVILYQILEKFGRKPFVNVKPNFSPEKCKNIVSLAKENFGSVITCPKWSYMDFYYAFYRDRKEIRKHNIFSRKTRDMVFLGNLDAPYRRPIADYTDKNYKYPVYPPQLDLLQHAPKDASREQVDVPYPLRPYFIEELEKVMPVQKIQGKSTRECLDVYLESKIHFQPHGVGPRHSIYECMMLGIPCLIPECSYLDSHTRKHHLICTEFMENIPVDDINTLLNDEKAYNDVKAGLIDEFENHMTHRAIIDNVFTQIENIL